MTHEKINKYTFDFISKIISKKALTINGCHKNTAQ